MTWGNTHSTPVSGEAALMIQLKKLCVRVLGLVRFDASSNGCMRGIYSAYVAGVWADFILSFCASAIFSKLHLTCNYCIHNQQLYI